MDQKADMKLFVCCHQESEVPDHPLLAPIQVGAALTGKRFPGFIADDTGDNISHKNRSYCELTAQYWAWKNSDADYLGFFHYRRYLYPDETQTRPYVIKSGPTLSLLKKLGYDGFAEKIVQYDLIAPKGEDMHLTVREHYAAAPHHRKEDLMIVEQIIREKYPEYLPAMDQYLSGSVCYFGNIYISRRAVFNDYCTWLFSILEEFDGLADWTDRTAQAKRVDGYLAERLFGVYLTHHRGALRVLELPRVHFEKNRGKRAKQILLGAILPPESRRRAWVKQACLRFIS